MKEIFGKYFRGDSVIWGIIIFLSLFSMLAVYSSTGTLAVKMQGGNTAYYFIKHSMFVFLGIAIILVVHLVPYRFFSKISILLLYLSVPLLFLTLVLGTSLNDASRWLTIPGIGISFQTSDLAKLALIMYIARSLAVKQDVIKDFKLAFQPIMIAILIICGLILPANFSTAALLFATTSILMFVGGINLKYLFSMFGVGALALTIFIVIVLNTNNTGRVGTWKNRIENFVSGDNQDANFQADQAKIAISTGGLFGKLPGNSTQRNFLPHPYSDFIFAIIVEEYGLFGGLFVMLLYLTLLYRAGKIVRKSTGSFAAFLAFGLTLSLVFQALINMAVAVNLFPVTGQTLPFVSMGGTSILFTSVALGIILSVSRDVNIEAKEAETETVASQQEVAKA